MKILLWSMLIFGLFEVISNAFHLTKKNMASIGESAKRQHQELPANIPAVHFFIKSIVMGLFGLAYFVISLLTLAGFSAPYMVEIAVFSFGLYGLIQLVVYYTEVKVWPAALVYNVFSILYWLKL